MLFYQKQNWHADETDEDGVEDNDDDDDDGAVTMMIRTRVMVLEKMNMRREYSQYLTDSHLHVMDS